MISQITIMPFGDTINCLQSPIARVKSNQLSPIDQSQWLPPNVLKYKPKIISSLIHSAHSLKRKYFPKFKQSTHPRIKNTSKSAESYTKMGALISMCSSSSRANSSARITDSSTGYPQPGQHISIRTFRELNQAQMSRTTSTRTGTLSSGESFRSMEDQQEEDNRQPTTLTPQRLTREVSQRLLESLRN
uniref:AC4 protein n=1 Tax=Cotton leaf curl Multan virus TaxID=223252 RepID=W0LYX2_9GEMI|nr:AC4 protein [Cotton leaf curl Multan virus]